MRPQAFELLSYANGVARQLMLAHPPYLLAARRYKAPAQHILIFGFGAVGQALAKEFLITSVSNNPRPMMITAIDPHRGPKGGISRPPAWPGRGCSRLGSSGDLRLREADALNELRARLAISLPALSTSPSAIAAGPAQLRPRHARTGDRSRGDGADLHMCSARRGLP